MLFNKCQSSLEELLIDKQPKEIQEQFYDYLNNVPFIRWLVSPERPLISDLPRDSEGKAIVDITKPPILTDTDYFRHTAILYQLNGRYSSLRPNPNPNSEFGKWLREERRRCWEGYINPKTGMWITGDLYFFLNYCPILLIKKGKRGESLRVVDFPNFWDGHFLVTQYITRARMEGHHASELASRGKGKSLLGAALLAKRFILGESEDVRKKVLCVVTAADRKYIYGAKQILNMFTENIDFCAINTQFASHRLVDSALSLNWVMGYKDKNTGVRKGSLNSVMGITSGDDQSKLNGSRGVLYLIEEAGIFNNLLSLYQMIRPSVEDGNAVFGEIFAYGCVCAGTKVWTNDGRYVNIEDLKKEDGIIGYQNDLPVKNTIGTLLEPRLKPCVRIEWKHGGFLECSVDHPILKLIVHVPRISGTDKRVRTPEEVFVRADQLKVGDRIIEGRVIDAFGNDTLGNDPRLIGMLIGDGTYGYDLTPCYSSEDKELLDYIKERYDWSYSCGHTTKEGKDYQEIRVKGICPLLRSLGIYGLTKTAKRLPINYMTLTKHDTALLLGGIIDADGCITKSGRDYCLEISQGNKPILEQIALLFRKFGITSSIVKNKPCIKEGRKDKHAWYLLSIGGRTNMELVYQNIPILLEKRRKRLEDAHKWYQENPSTKPACFDLTKIIVHKITKISYIGVLTIYNLSAEQSHTYLANNIITHNTAGDDQSDFTALLEIMYNPDGYNMQAVPNVYDKVGQGRQLFTYFFPAYLNRAECMDKDGNSNVTKALLELLIDRYKVKYNSTDINLITKRISQYPITPQEAIIRAQGSIFPITELNERLNQIDNNPSEYDDVYVGSLVLGKDGQVEFKPTNDLPIRDFPTKDNKVVGAIEIFSMPLKNPDGKVPLDRYILSCDPYRSDGADTMSLGSLFVMDLWTDTIVAEYTGRPMFVDDFSEICRKMCLFYNGKLIYENNIKGIFTYFSTHNSLHMLADTPEYLKDRQIIKNIGYGNSSKGINASNAVKEYGYRLIRDWLLKPINVVLKDEEGKDVEVTMPNLYRIRNRALLKELVLWNPEINVDRISSLILLMLYREEKMVLYQGDLTRTSKVTAKTGKLFDDYFERNYKAPNDTIKSPFLNY